MKSKLTKEAVGKEKISAHCTDTISNPPLLPTGDDIHLVTVPLVFLLVGSHMITKGLITNEETVEQFSTCSNAALWWAKTVKLMTTKHKGKEANYKDLNKNKHVPDPKKKCASPCDKIEIQD